MAFIENTGHSDCLRTMPALLGINGFGRRGMLVFRAASANPDVQRPLHPSRLPIFFNLYLGRTCRSQRRARYLVTGILMSTDLGDSHKFFLQLPDNNIITIGAVATIAHMLQVRHSTDGPRATYAKVAQALRKNQRWVKVVFGIISGNPFRALSPFVFQSLRFKKHSSSTHREHASNDVVVQQRTEVQTVDIPVPHTGSMLPTTLWGKSPCEVAESVIRRPLNTSSWTGSEAECRDAVCLAPNDVVGKVPVRSCRECHQKTAEHQFVDRQWRRVPRCGLRWSSSQQHSHAVRAVRPTRTKSTYCRQSSIRLHSAHTGSMLPTTLWGKSPCEVAESVIRRPQNTSLWTGSEAECRDAVCVGVLRNNTVMP